MKSPYPAAAIANYFIKKNRETPADLTHLKIQKLLFFAQGWFIANYGIPLFDESFEAWRHGPVVRSIYHSLSGSKDSIIDHEITSVFTDESGQPKYGAPEIEEGDSIAKTFLDSFWRLYSPINAFQLSAMTHQPGTPWYKIYERYNKCLPYGAEIDNTDIQKYFVQKKIEAEQVK